MSPLTHDERAELVESVRDLAWQFVWEIVVPRLGHGEAEDAFQGCMLAAWECSGRFDPALGCKFTTYVYRRMFWTAREYVRKGLAGRRMLQADEDTPDPLAPADLSVETADSAARVRRFLARLPDRWRQVIEMRFGIGTGRPLTHAEVGARMGFTKGRSEQLEFKIIARLRKFMGVAA